MRSRGMLARDGANSNLTDCKWVAFVRSWFFPAARAMGNLARSKLFVHHLQHDGVGGRFFRYRRRVPRRQTTAATCLRTGFASLAGRSGNLEG